MQDPLDYTYRHESDFGFVLKNASGEERQTLKSEKEYSCILSLMVLEKESSRPDLW